jgi:hypothetical protein
MSQKILSENEWTTFQRHRQFTNSGYQNSLAKGFLKKFGDRVAGNHQEHLRYLDKHGDAYDVREYIENELVEK